MLSVMRHVFNRLCVFLWGLREDVPYSVNAQNKFICLFVADNPDSQNTHVDFNGLLCIVTNRCYSTKITFFRRMESWSATVAVVPFRIIHVFDKLTDVPFTSIWCLFWRFEGTNSNEFFLCSPKKTYGVKFKEKFYRIQLIIF